MAVGTFALSAPSLSKALGKPAHIPSGGTEKPNVIFILTDDLGWGDLGCYGNREIKTPNLDRLARQGTLFTQFYVNSAVCSPSRTAFMTGHFPARYSIHGHLATPKQNEDRGMPNFLDPSPPMVTRLLQQAGYRTAHFGKWHLGSGEGAPSPGAYGIDVHKTVNANGPSLQTGKDPYFRAKSTGLMVDEAIRFIETDRDQPFYVNLWTLVPHATLHPTEEQMKPYRRFAPGKNLPYKGAKQIYYASVTDMDAQIGRLLEKLDELELTDNTIVIFSSDNGPEDIHIRNAVHSAIGSPGPFRGRKRSLYEGGVRMPFIVRWPGHTPAGRIDDTSVLSAVDFLPTMCRAAEVPLPEGYTSDGEDALDVLRGNPRPRSKPIMWEWRFPVHGYTIHRSPMLAIRDGDWKLLMNPDGSRVELYNIQKNPSEVDNLADQHPDIVKRLSRQVLDWQKTLPEGPIYPGAGDNSYPWPVKGTRG
jgi:N-acetylgalactosamine-6-sulfatase